MNCDLGNCTTSFADTEDGLTTMIFHKLIKHQSWEINGERTIGRLDC
jgi:hypothetical protein